jgi:hypothetical protein
MNRTKQRILSVLVGTITVVGYAGAASADAESLRCSAVSKRYQARLLRCVSHCEAYGDATRSVPCHSRCEDDYEAALAARSCGDEWPNATQVCADALMRQARSEQLAAQKLQCRVRCERFDSRGRCESRCERRFAQND